MKHLIKILSALIIFPLMFTTVSCSKSNPNDLSSSQATTSSEATNAPTPTPTPPPSYPEQVIISNGDISFGEVSEDYYTVNCEHVDYLDLEYNYLPREVSITMEEWTSSDDSVAIISDTGRLTPVGYGECEITLHVSDGLTDGAYASITVTVGDGIIEIANQNLPDFNSLRENCFAAYGENLFFVQEGSFTNIYELGEHPYIACEYYTNSFYCEYSIDNDIRSMDKFIICRNDTYTLLIYEHGFSLITDEYILLVFDYALTTPPEVAESIGIPLPTEEIDIPFW